MLELRDGVNTRLVWSAPELTARSRPRTVATCCCSAVPSPTWRGTASPPPSPTSPQQLGVSKMAALGAYPFAAPHTRPPHLSATSPSAEVLAALPFRTSSVDVPAGMAAALEHAVAERGIPAARHLGAGPALRRDDVVPGGLGGPARGPDAGHRDHASTPPSCGARRCCSGERLDQLVEGNDEHRAMVAQFERLYDAAEQEAERSAGRRPVGRRARAALGRRAGRRGRALPARPGQELTRQLGDARSPTFVGHEGRRRHPQHHQQGRRPGGASSKQPATPAAGRPRPATTRSCRCCSRPSTPTDLELGTSIAVAFARNPMTLANIGWDLQAYSQGRFILGLGSQIKPHITKRFSMEWSHPAPRMREMILAIRAIWDTWQNGTKLEFRGDFYTHTLMTPFFTPDQGDLGGFGVPKIFLAGVGELMTEVAGEVCDGFLCHGFTTERYLREVTIPALERGRAKAGKTMDGLRDRRAELRRHRHRRRASWSRRPPAPASRSRSTARRRRTSRCSSSTAGAACRRS